MEKVLFSAGGRGLTPNGKSHELFPLFVLEHFPLRNLDERDNPKDVRSEESKHHDNLTNAEEHLHSAPA